MSRERNARWADGKNWVYDFDRDLPAGTVCTFSLKPYLKTLSGKPVAGQTEVLLINRRTAVNEVIPDEGSEHISEDQIFVLKLAAEAEEESVLANVFCSIEGIQEKIGIRRISGEEKEQIVKEQYRLKNTPYMLVQCRQSFPNRATVKLVWGKGIATGGGVRNVQDQVFTFKVRDAFTAKLRCERENKNADCIRSFLCV